MTVYQPKQRQADGRWDYTITNSVGCFPAGYCAGWHDEIRAGIPVSEETQRQWLEKKLPFKERYHSNGHTTADEATECYLRYRIDQRLRVEEDPKTQKKCFVCGSWTTWTVFLASVEQQPACPRHQDRETLFKHWPRRS